MKNSKRNAVHSGSTIADKQNVLAMAALRLSDAMELLATAELSSALNAPDVTKGIDFYQEVTLFEITLIKQALRVTKGNQSLAAKLLHLNHTTLNCKVKQYKIDPRAVLLSV
jgi:DNA-binding protein Fis